MKNTKRRTKRAPKAPLITESQELSLLGALLFKRLPVIYNASAIALRRAGLIRSDRQGNFLLTVPGTRVATKILKARSKAAKAA